MGLTESKTGQIMKINQMEEREYDRCLNCKKIRGEAWI